MKVQTLILKVLYNSAFTFEFNNVCVHECVFVQVYQCVYTWTKIELSS